MAAVPVTFDIKGYKEVVELLNTPNSPKKLKAAFGLAVLQLHNFLKYTLHDKYSVKKSLDTVRVVGQRSASTLQLGQSFITYGLQYEDKGIPLAQYAHQLDTVSVSGIMPLRELPGGKWSSAKKDIELTAEGRVRTLEATKATKVRVAIQRGKYKEKYLGARPAFFQRGLTGKNTLQRNYIFARKTDDTWKNFPSQGVEGRRAPYKEIYGPSLASLALKEFDTNPLLENTLLDMEDTIGKILVEGTAGTVFYY